MAVYSWLTQSSAVAQMQARLSNAQLWTQAECWIYLTEALRAWNALTEQWNTEFKLIDANGAWINTGTTTGSPRLRSVTDQYLYNQMTYMLLENQLSSGAWAGTSQFNLTQLQNALQKRTQEVIQASQSNLGLATATLTPGTRRTLLADTVLEPRRIRFLGVVGSSTANGSSGSQTITLTSGTAPQGAYIVGTGIQPYTFVTKAAGSVISLSKPTTGVLSNTDVQFQVSMTLMREDTQTFQYFEPDYLQTIQTPLSWSIASEPPLAFDVDNAPNVPGQYDIIQLQSGPVFSPPTPSLLGVPDDWSWLPLYGAMADLLGAEAEATDRARAAYCMQRYQMGLEAMKQSNWLLQAQVNGIPVDTPPLKEMDDYLPEWQTKTGLIPSVVQAGMDMVAPTYGLGQSLLLTLVGNAPLLDDTNTYVQVSRDDWNAVLDYSVHLAAFKQGNAEFENTSGLLQNFFQSAAEVNKRLLSMGLFVETLRTQGQREVVHGN